jgi:hypothetical protein
MLRGFWVPLPVVLVATKRDNVSSWPGWVYEGALPDSTTSCHCAAVLVDRIAVPPDQAVVFGTVGKPASVSCWDVRMTVSLAGAADADGAPASTESGTSNETAAIETPAVTFMTSPPNRFPRPREVLVPRWSVLGSELPSSGRTTSRRRTGSECHETDTTGPGR